jgi:pimeloyl-ACP methyl ester carboxylesterase
VQTLNGWPVSPSRTVPAPDGGVISYRERPGPTPDAPTVLLLHGLGATSGLQFMPTLEQLSADFRVLALDMRANRQRGRDLLTSVAQDAVSLLDAAGVERVVVLGYSVGGLVARYLAAAAPERVAGVVLAATADPPRVPGARTTARVAAGGASLVPLRWPRGSEASTFRFAVGELGRLSPVVLLRAVEHALAGQAPSPADLIQPVVFLVTTRDRLVPAAWQRRLAATRPGAPVLEVAAGHAASGLEPEVFGPAALRACRLAAEMQSA